ncbi:(NiFe) hydrogenase maturation protein HypF [Chlorobaculum parvum NCIB 8327]|uniref:Carbamoyltransferase n=1 Tax=Chlorobaculum parvum (strain DSM 263 / NCIMB 8327) TaxID=517417 RepID=B3QQ31_CHLP8|nr:(NiFe) hydrogenase maturation protein HypF [Chlorobaculum parvum NCIB 8327]
MDRLAERQTRGALSGSSHCERRRIEVRGIVQGVGFRPFVWRLAHQLDLAGFVCNASSGVVIEVEGEPNALDRFEAALRDEAPPLSRIDSIDRQSIPSVCGEQGFVISESSGGDAMQTLISPDIAVCPACLADIADPAGRRYRYAFTNCTDCGPRYTIVERIPYDRPFTTMKGFALCPDCQREYDDPADRRFHAQPNACPVCGPKLELRDAAGVRLEVGDEITAAGELLAGGKILAIKGIGGFHLAVDASNEQAVQLLRTRKGREEKPFAVMVRDLDTARALCEIGPEEEVALASPQAPIVLLRKRSDLPLAPSISPGNDRLGVILPYSPLHWLLLREGPEVLVMTSANFSEEPLVADNAEALERLTGIADAFLMHDRPIARRCDDSVVMSMADAVRLIRRSRGYAPAPIRLRQSGPPVLGTGGELKNALCLVKGGEAFLSQHIGDMKNYEAYRHFDDVAAHLQRIFQTEAELLVHDLHPAYMTTRWALEQGKPTLGVQHHHAHLASCLAEHRCDGPAIGLTLDGTGYGPDGTVWGGEVLIGVAAGATRFASLEPMPLPGGDAATRQVWRTALGWLHRSCASPEGLECLRQPQSAQVLELLDKGVGTAESSSCGRLFDAVASICALRHEARYEGQAAIELMQAARGQIADTAYSFGIERRDSRWQMLVSPIIRDIAKAVQAGAKAGEIAQRFHRTLVVMLSEITRKAYLETGLKTVALSGGVFQNVLLVEALVHELEAAGFTVLLHQQVPTNDGGISLGQAVIGQEFLRGRYRGVDS